MPLHSFSPTPVFELHRNQRNHIPSCICLNYYADCSFVYLHTSPYLLLQPRCTLHPPSLFALRPHRSAFSQHRTRINTCCVLSTLIGVGGPQEQGKDGSIGHTPWMGLALSISGPLSVWFPYIKCSFFCSLPSWLLVFSQISNSFTFPQGSLSY